LLFREIGLGLEIGGGDKRTGMEGESQSLEHEGNT